MPIDSNNYQSESLKSTIDSSRLQDIESKLKNLRKRFAMYSGMNEIIPNLFLGGLRDVTDINQLTKNKIEYIVSVHDVLNVEYAGNKNIKILRIRIADSPSENISQYFPEAIQFIHEARIKGGAVAVHCLAGISRSATIVASYLITVCGLTFFNALSYISSKRPAVNPNFGFRMQLCKYEKQPAQIEREKLRKHFGTSVFDRQWQLDRIATRCKIVTQNSPELNIQLGGNHSTDDSGNSLPGTSSSTVSGYR